ncbi:PadR family transcriptional regulator [Schumannella sp. 10F1B-5-1]|uniref:PadR family transcriptional regulator n=1 Tax=Schumannella sp. 10F1B-5-1 TaxID=2590780 RepID=UPI001131937B|nr:PadR family transcriptional regulator [Schumannella sp. 10F1B-5-1]TPW76932.1 helix-turn-helix transcriptional regulator [Schumannella sp. 10F1B-5-1]
MSPAVFAHGHLRLYLLSLLAERSMHGYELIHALSDRFGGTYVPSAGTIYPRLAKLEEDGMVTKQPDGRKTVYAITDAGRAELAEREHELDQVENDVTDTVRRLADEVRSSVDGAMKSLRAELAAAAREARTDARSAGYVNRDAEWQARFGDRAGTTGSSGAATATGTSADADSGAGTAGGSATTSTAGRVDARSASQAHLHEAEAAITDFRQQLRTDLRRAAARGELAADTVDALRTGLAALAADLRRTLR